MDDDIEIQQARVAIKQEAAQEAAQERREAEDKIAAEENKAVNAVVGPACLHCSLVSGGVVGNCFAVDGMML